VVVNHLLKLNNLNNMRKIALILGMFIALTFMSMNSVQAETSTWTVNHYCMHDSNDVSIEEHPDIEPFVLTMVAKANKGDYGTISMDNEEKTTYNLVEFSAGRKGNNYKTFYFRAIDNDSIECLINVILYTDGSNYAFSLSVTYPDKILYWTGVLIAFEEAERKILTYWQQHQSL